MHVVNANNINHAFKQGLSLLLRHAGINEPSRNGAVIRVLEPVTTVYANPRMRVLENKVRNANPFFHLMEALWMLAGRNDLKFVSLFNSRMATYTDDGKTQPAAYGYRWRKHFSDPHDGEPVDQIKFVIDELKRAPHSRRAVITMADPMVDIEAVRNGGADVPCNTGIYFIIRGDGRLDMTVTCRSNDAIWGCYGANAVHMSILHEYVAQCVGVEMGLYYQISNDLHAYTDVFSVEKLNEMLTCQLTTYGETPSPLFMLRDTVQKFDADLETLFYLFDEGMLGQITQEHFCSAYFRHTVSHMLTSWLAYKVGHRDEAYSAAESISCPSWRRACCDWLRNAWEKRSAA